MSMSAENAVQCLDSFNSVSDSKRHVDAGALHFQRGDSRSAIAELRKAIEICPTNPVAHSNLGVVLCKIGQAKEGICHLERALALDPNISGVAEFLRSTKQQFGV